MTPPTLAIYCETRELIRPVPRLPGGGGVAIRVATPGAEDLAFIDALQKKHNKMVGFFPRAWVQSNIAAGNVLIAEETVDEPRPSGSGVGAGAGARAPLPYGRGSLATPVGYCLYKDKYLKREELGIVHQLNVAPGKQRGLVGAALVKAAFERCPYGVKLFCCWCAQDIEANRFWEALGFVPLAFRAGSRGKDQGGKRQQGRVHIFWQRRIRAGDGETPYWFPSETSGGALKENRIVLPIPPGTHWSDAKPAIVPGMPQIEATSAGQLPTAGEVEAKPRERKRQSKAKPAMAGQPKRGLWFAPPASAAPPKPEKAKPARQRMKNDPKFIAAARELRDRYLEQVNADRMLPSGGAWGGGKYDVSRQLETSCADRPKVAISPLLEAA